jgi:hypothetical protein
MKNQKNHENQIASIGEAPQWGAVFLCPAQKAYPNSPSNVTLFINFS